MRRLLLILSCLLLVAACGASAPPENASLRASLIDAVRSTSDGQTLDLTGPLGGSWDRVALFPPYARNADARDVLGFPFDVEASPTANDDYGTVFVLAKDRQLVGWFVLPWSDVGTGSWSTSPRVISASQAKFVVQVVGPNGHREMEPTTGP